MPQGLEAIGGVKRFIRGITCSIYYKTLTRDLFDIEFYTNQLCLVYVVAGKEHIMSKPNHRVTLTHGSAILLTPGETLHSDYFSASGALKAWLVFFSPTMLAHLPQAQPDKKGHNTFPAFIPLSHSALLAPFFDSLEAYHRDNLLNDGMLHAKATELLLLINSLSPTPLHQLQYSLTGSAGFNIQFKKLIEDSDYLSLSVADLARLCNMPSTSFARKFKATYSMTPKQWLVDKRLMYAKTQLALKDWSVTDIATDIGYADPSHFIKLFKSKFGVTPHQYKSSGEKNRFC
nr:AraC family transcriptional regulator [Pseudoalteromonas citrea]